MGVARATSDQIPLARAGGDLRPDVERVLASGGELVGSAQSTASRPGAGRCTLCCTPKRTAARHQ
jgi:hypothetical protein